jgi:hypothetical protein
MKRAIFVAGTWQVVSAAAALAQHQEGRPARGEDTLVLFGHGSPEFKSAMERVAKHVWPWQRICWADDVLVSYFPTRKFAPVARDVLRQRLGDDIGEVWVAKLYADPAKLVLFAFPDSDVYLYEDGAEEFFEQEILCGWRRFRSARARRWPGLLKREASHWGGRAPECTGLIGICNPMRQRVKGLYSFLAATFPVPGHFADVPLCKVGNPAMSGRLSALKELVPDDAAVPVRDRRAVLFLPQPFAEPGSLTDDQEYQLYREAVAALVRQGYRVLWKEHPRQRISHLPRLQSEMPEGKIESVKLPQGYPIECLTSGWELAGAVTVSSSAVIYLQALYGIPAFTMAHRIPPAAWKLEVDAKLAQLFTRHITTLESMG